MGSILDVKSSGLGSVKKSVKGFVNKKRKPIRIKKHRTIHSSMQKSKVVKPKIMSKREYIATIPQSTKKEWAKDVGGLQKAYRDAYNGYKIRMGKK